MPMDRAIVAQFVKWGNGEPIRLWSFTIVQEKQGYGGGIYISQDEYDVEWSRKYDCYLFHMSGFGGRVVQVMGPYHVSGSANVKEKTATWCNQHDRPPWRGKRTLKIRHRNRTRRLRQLPMCINQMCAEWDLLDWLEHNAIQADAVYCSECDDWLPDTSDDPCDHVWWCDKTCWWSSPSERCKCKDRDECCDRC